jgi:hypothetical protein
MIISSIAGKVTTIFLSMNIATVLTFSEPVKTYLYGGESTALFSQRVNNQKTIVLKPIKKNIESNFLVITKSRQYNFYFKLDNKRPHDFVIVQNGFVMGATRTIKKSNDIEIREGGSFLRIKNRSKKPFVLNHEVVLPGKSVNASKGGPLIINGTRILN